MNDPYRVLGVSPNATDDEVKEAYRSLAKKYHPDNYAGSPIADLASEKMKEVNEAYDQVTSERKAARQRGSSSQNAGGQSASENYHQYWGGGYQTSTGFGDVRSLIATGRIADAEQILNGVPTSGRNAEWFFLKGTVLYKRGWLDEATNHFTRACQMDPGTPEYRAALNQITGQRYGQYGGYNPQTDTVNSGCSACDVCSSLMVADCCCECMGGDLIPCC